MHEWWTLAPAPVAGMLLGTAFFGGLWWTVRQGVFVPAAGGLVPGQRAGADQDPAGRILLCLGRSWGPAAGLSPRICHRAFLS